MITCGTVAYFIMFFMLCLAGLVINYAGNLFYYLIFLELCMLSLILNCIFISILLDDPRCILYALILFAVAAVDSAIGLSLVLLYQRVGGHIFYTYSVNG